MKPKTLQNDTADKFRRPIINPESDYKLFSALKVNEMCLLQKKE